MKYKIGNIVKLKNDSICKIIGFYEYSLETEKPYIVEVNGERANFIVTDDMIKEKIK